MGQTPVPGVGLQDPYSGSCAYNFFLDEDGPNGHVSVPDGQGGTTYVDTIGSITTEFKGDIQACFKWVYTDASGHPAAAPPGSHAPDHMTLLLENTLYASAQVEYNGSGKTSGLLAYAGVGTGAPYPDEHVGVLVNAPGGTYDHPDSASRSQGLTRGHLVSPVLDSNGVGTVELKNVQIDTSADNEIPYGAMVPYEGHADDLVYTATNGPTQAETMSFLRARATPISPLQAHSTAGTVDTSNPLWFSGTNCQVLGHLHMGELYTEPGVYVTHAELLIGVQVVRRYHDSSLAAEPGLDPATAGGDVQDDTGNHLTDAELKVAFDSTHFGDGTPIPITLKVWDSTGNYNESTLSAPAKNRAYIVGNHTLGDVSSEITDASYAFGENYFCKSSDQERKTTILETLPYFTAFYIITHGNREDFADSFYESVPNDPYATYDTNTEMSYQEVAGAISIKQGNSNLPPYNLVWLDACQTSGQTALCPVYFLANAFNISEGDIDRVYIGWHNEVFGTEDANVEWRKRVWHNLTHGDDVLLAAIKGSAEGDPSGELIAGDEDSSGPVFPFIEGDRRTKLHGVYKGKVRHYTIPEFGVATSVDWFKAL